MARLTNQLYSLVPSPRATCLSFSLSGRLILSLVYFILSIIISWDISTLERVNINNGFIGNSSLYLQRPLSSWILNYYYKHEWFRYFFLTSSITFLSSKINFMKYFFDLSNIPYSRHINTAVASWRSKKHTISVIVLLSRYKYILLSIRLLSLSFC